MRYSGLDGVTVRPVAGHLTDHYDPRSRTLNLSESVGQAATVAALGVAAHEAGHAIQDARQLPRRCASARRSCRPRSSASRSGSCR